MREELEQALASDSRGVFVTIDVAMEALDTNRSRTFAIAKSEGWKVAAGTRPRQYLFNDIRTTYNRRKNAGAS